MSWREEWKEKFQPHFRGFWRENLPLAPFTYYRIGGPADLLVIPEGREDVEVLDAFFRAVECPFFILGLGSNLLVSDEGFRGVVVRGNRFNLELSEISPGCVRGGASVSNGTLLRRAVKEGWRGFDFLGGIPGSLGGAVWMNAGTALVEVKDVLVKVEAFEFRSLEGGGRGWQTFDASQFRFGYRKNGFLKASHCIWATEWKIERGSSEEVREEIERLLQKRKRAQPLEFPSCGSVFRNPRDQELSAWEVIDRLGLRGKRLGGAEVSSQHCNFIINRGGATAGEVRALIQEIQQSALEKLGILLEREVLFLDAYGIT